VIDALLSGTTRRRRREKSGGSASRALGTVPDSHAPMIVFFVGRKILYRGRSIQIQGEKPNAAITTP
jgi:hypothetical protein